MNCLPLSHLFRLLTALAVCWLPLAVHAEAPVNDLRAQALPLAPGGDIAGTVAEATVDEGEAVPEEGAQGTVWHAWTAAAGVWEAQVTSSYGYVEVAVYEEAGGVLREAARSAFIEYSGSGDTNRHKARFHTAAGARMFFQVYRRSWDGGNFTLSLQPMTSRPAEDDFGQATRLPAVVRDVAIPLAGATLEPGEPRTWRDWQGSVWREWQAPAAGRWLFRFEHGAGYAAMDVWRGSTLATLESAVVASGSGEPEDGGGFLPSSPCVVSATAGEVLRVRILTPDDFAACLTIGAVSAGDMFDQPVDLGSGESVSHTRKLSEPMTNERGEGTFAGGAQWLAWTCPASGVYELRSAAPWQQSGGIWCSGLTPVVIMYRGSAVNALTRVPEVPVGIAYSPQRFRAVAGERLSIRVGISTLGGCYTSFGRNSGSGGAVIAGSFGPTEVTVALNRLTPLPAHDDFAKAHDHGNSADVSATGSNTGATNEPGEVIGTYRAGDSVWHRWTAPLTGRYEFYATSPALLEARIYKGTALDALTEVTWGRGFYGEPRAGEVQLRFPATAGAVHYFRLAGNGYGEQGSYSFRLRRVVPPANDLLAAAAPLGSSVPVSAAGDTSFAGGESGLDEGTSSIWWRWTAPAAGIYEVNAPGASLGLLENGARYGYTLDLGSGHLRFMAAAGRTYSLRAAHHMSREGPVALTLDRAAGLDYATQETAHDAGNAPRFSSPLLPVATGAWHTASGQKVGALWVRWTSPHNGWVSVDTAGSSEPGQIAVYAAADFTQPLARNDIFTSLTGSLMERGLSWFSSPQPLRGPLENWTLRDRSLAPELRRLLVPVSAGKTYFFTAAPGTTALAQMQVNVRPSGPPPTVSATSVSLTAAHRATHASVLLRVTSPNGFTWGQVQIQQQHAGFTDAHRVSGDAFDGEYRVSFPSFEYSETTSLELHVTAHDAAGGSISSLTAPDRVDFPAAAETTAPPDREGPVLDGVLAAPSVIVLDGTDVSVMLELGITDGGGSGFAEGEVLMASADGGEYGAPEPHRVRFGPAQRLRGDASAGVYAVSFTLPAGWQGGTLLCRLRDAAGNFAGRWHYSGSNCFNCDNVCVVCDNVALQNQPRSLGRWQFTSLLALPVSIVQQRPVDGVAVDIREAIADLLPATGEVRLRGRLAHPAGITGGSVSLADEHGVVQSSVPYTAAQRVSGSAQDGFYEIRFPIPPHGFAGPHWLAWRAHSGAGSMETQNQIGPVALPDRTAGDARRPRLTRLQLSPSAVNLLTAPATLALSLAASDDRPGLTARVRILDSDDRELAARTFTCAALSFDCTETLTLPRVRTTGPATAARVIVVLTDAAGRTQIYGQPWSPPWPDAAAAALILAPASPDTFARWAAAWSLPDLPAHAARDTDHDGTPDMMEFALATDPAAPPRRDPFAARSPHMELSPASGWPLTLWPSLRWNFTPAPWFQHHEDRYLCDAWQLTAESTRDLRAFTAAPLPARANAIHMANSPAVSIPAGTPPQEPAQFHRLRLHRAP